MPEVNPEILTWARETNGLTPEEAAKKLGFRDTRKRTAVERLRDYETGQDAPSRSVLTKMAKQYRRPLIAFYLSYPPPRGDRGTDFRTVRSRAYTDADAVVLDALIRDVRARQSMVRAALEAEDEAEHLSFIGSKTTSDGRTTALAALRAVIGVSLTEFRSRPNAEEGFSLLRKAAEGARVFVLLKGDLGSYHTAIDLEVFRGFAIADDVAPFVVINDRDARSAWSFTLLHEMVHLLLGQTGIGRSVADSELERFCDGVAGDFLLPPEDLAHLQVSNAKLSDRAVEQRIGNFARERNLSRTMVAYQAHRFGLIDQEDFNRIYHSFRQQWLDDRDARRESSRGQNVRVDYYRVRRHRTGSGLISLVSRMLSAEALSTTKAAKILGVRPHQVQAMISGG